MVDEREHSLGCPAVAGAPEFCTCDNEDTTTLSYDKHNPAKMLRDIQPLLIACKCGHQDWIGPYEMDGYDAEGTYRASGLSWITCRGCGRSKRVTA